MLSIEIEGEIFVILFPSFSPFFFLDCQRMTVSSKRADRIVRIVPVGVERRKT